MEFVRERLKPLPGILQKIDRRLGEMFVESLESFAHHVFKTHSNFLSVTLLPTIRLDFKNEILDESDDEVSED